MELNFANDGTKWVAEFEATGDFNLHIEKGEGLLSVSQTTISGVGYDAVQALAMGNMDNVMDKDCIGIVYPKYMRVVAFTESAPTGVVTFKE